MSDDTRNAAAWDTPIEEMLARYLVVIADREDREAVGAYLSAALRAEPIARGCPSLAMLTPIDLFGVRAHLEMHGAGDIDAAVAALEGFLSWGREVGAHSLSDVVIAMALQPSDL